MQCAKTALILLYIIVLESLFHPKFQEINDLVGFTSNKSNISTRNNIHDGNLSCVLSLNGGLIMCICTKCTMYVCAFE